MSGVAKPPKRTDLETILGALGEIECHFECQGFSNEDDAVEVKTGGEELDSDDDLEDSESGPDVFDAEEIEIAIDAFLSRLIDAKIVKKAKGRHAPSMVFAFNGMFGEDHELAKLVEEFEDHVAGYFGWVSFDDMEKAQGQLMAIKDVLARMVEGTSE